MQECIRCGECCSKFPMTTEQIERIKDFLIQNPRVVRILKETKSPFKNSCLFLRNVFGECFCTIYEVRPEICKAFGTEGVEELKCYNGAKLNNYTPEEVKKLLEVYEIESDKIIYKEEVTKIFMNFLKSY